ncbi:hypothetical protein AA313_de0205586 [Arthrobotrys entomopaga]|nr:hypothetical protein AA313_de0205586 [Arthrobotrys entomopaga]
MRSTTRSISFFKVSPTPLLRSHSTSLPLITIHRIHLINYPIDIRKTQAQARTMDGVSSRGGRGSYRGGGSRYYNDNTSNSNTNNAESSSHPAGGRGGRGGGGRGGGRGRGGRGGFNLSGAKAARARAARETINETIPHILSHTPRAQTGVDSSRRYTPSNLPALPKKPSTYIPHISIINSDTFTAAETIISNLQSSRPTEYNNGTGPLRVAVLNMASNVQPGGGVLNGSQAQEETLCRRSTLYPSLARNNINSNDNNGNGSFYPLSAGMVIYTPDVLVFMTQNYEMLNSNERYWVDVISAAAPKRPELTSTTTTTNRNGGEAYADQSDYEALVTTVKSMMRVAVMKGVTHLVLGAFGCGAYGNPNRVVAEVFKRVTCGRKFGGGGDGGDGGWEREEREVWETIEEVSFAIYGHDRGKGNLDVFEEVFRDVIEYQNRSKISENVEVGVEDAAVPAEKSGEDAV